MGHKNLKSLSTLWASTPMKTVIIQLVFSVSVLSFVFSCSSLWSSTLMYSRKLNYFSSNSSYLLTAAMNKSCIFLICNGLLVLLAKTSGHVPSPSAPWGFDSDNVVLQKRIGGGLELEVPLEKTESETLFEKHVIFEESGEKITMPAEASSFMAESSERGGTGCGLEDVESDDSDDSIDGWLLDDDEEEEEDETETMSSEELNMKFEDFIRRMKEEIKVNEARGRREQQQTVVVKL